MLITFFGVNCQNMINEDFWQKDKVAHSIVGFGISACAYTYLSLHNKHKNLTKFQRRTISFSVALLAGGLKEVTDSFSSKHDASWGDIGANMAGALAFQVTISIPLNKKRKGNKEKN